MNNNYFNPNMYNGPMMMGNAPIVTRSVPMGMGMGRSLPRLSSFFGGTPAVRTVGTATGTTSKVTFSGILNGASKTLGVINQAIPVFYQVKPIWRNAKTMFRVAKELNSNDNMNTKNEVKKVANTEQKKENSDGSPTFFI